jgi:hypothetical protein
MLHNDINAIICSQLDIASVAQLMATCKQFDYIRIEKSLRINSAAIVKTRQVCLFGLIETIIKSPMKVDRNIMYTYGSNLCEFAPIMMYVGGDACITFIDEYCYGRVVVWRDYVGPTLGTYDISAFVSCKPIDLFDLVEIAALFRKFPDDIMHDLDSIHKVEAEFASKQLATPNWIDLCTNIAIVKYIRNI